MAKSSITVIGNLEQAWLFLVAAEKASELFHYPEELRQKIQSVKRATAKLKLLSMSVNGKAEAAK